MMYAYIIFFFFKWNLLTFSFTLFFFGFRVQILNNMISFTTIFLLIFQGTIVDFGKGLERDVTVVNPLNHRLRLCVLLFSGQSFTFVVIFHAISSCIETIYITLKESILRRVERKHIQIWIFPGPKLLDVGTFRYDHLPDHTGSVKRIFIFNKTAIFHWISNITLLFSTKLRRIGLLCLRWISCPWTIVSALEKRKILENWSARPIIYLIYSKK